MIVWIVQSGGYHDGSGTDAIFETEQKAIWYSKWKARKENKRDRRRNPRRRRQHWSKDTELTKEQVYRLVNRSPQLRRQAHNQRCWENGYDFISISPKEVL